MSKNLPIYIIAGVIGLLAAYSGFSGKRILFVASPRTAVIVLTVVGMIMCSSAAMGLFISRAPAHPLSILGYVLGLLALLTGVVQVFKLKVPVLCDPKLALIVITCIIVVKIVIARLNFLLPMK